MLAPVERHLVLVALVVEAIEASLPQSCNSIVSQQSVTLISHSWSIVTKLTHYKDPFKIKKKIYVKNIFDSPTVAS